MKPLQSPVISDNVEFSSHQVMLEMSGEIHNGQKSLFRDGISAVSFAEGFGCLQDDAF